MNYDRIILELLDRVASLEAEVKALKEGKPLNGDSPSQTDRAVNYIKESLVQAKEEGLPYLDLVCNDVHRAVGLKGRHAVVCNAMRKAGHEYRFEVLRDTPSHSSSTYTVRYYL